MQRRTKRLLIFLAVLFGLLACVFVFGNIHVSFANYLKLREGMPLIEVCEILKSPPTRHFWQDDVGYWYYWDGLQGTVWCDTDGKGHVRRLGFDDSNLMTQISLIAKQTVGINTSIDREQ